MDNLTQEVAQAQEVSQEVSLVAVPNIENLLSIAEGIDDTAKSIGITAEYLPFNVTGETVRGVFAGFRTASFKDAEATIKAEGVQQYKDSKMAVWLTKTKTGVKTYCNAGVSLVDELEKNSVPVGTVIDITLTKIAGKVKVFQIGIVVKN